jgi:hypothetical protein
VVSRASLVRGGYFESGSLPEKIIKIIFAPLAYTYALFEVRKRMTENIPNGILKYSNQKQLHLQENLCTYQWREPLLPVLSLLI